MSELLPTVSRVASKASVRPIKASVQPIVSGFFPDPTICRVGADYYLAHSSFEYFPGAPIFHSRDLVTWTQIGNILTRRSQFRRGTAGPSTGIYGSTLRYHDSRFWFITTNVSDFESGQVIVHATDPAGPWSEPIFVPEAVGIDPDLCWDEDGTCYLTWHALDFVKGGQGIVQSTIDLATGHLTDAPYPVWQGSGMPAAEGPHLYRIGDFWYLLLAEGGTERGHSVTVARSSSPRGPFEGAPVNPVFTRRSSIHAVQNVGHADLVDTPDGAWAAVYLGVRPRGSTPGYHVLGRETFLAGIDFVDGWPVFDEDRFDVPVESTAFVDVFSDDDLHPRWVVPGGEPASIARPVPGGGLLLTPHEGQAGQLCTRVRDLVWRADASVEDNGRFALWLDSRHWLGLEFDGGEVRAVVRIGDLSRTLASLPALGEHAQLRIQSAVPTTRPVPMGHAGPDDLVLSADVGDGFVQLARVDGRYFSTEVASGFTGRMLALSAINPGAHVRSIDYRPLEAEATEIPE